MKLVLEHIVSLSLRLWKRCDDKIQIYSGAFERDVWWQRQRFDTEPQCILIEPCHHSWAKAVLHCQTCTIQSFCGVKCSENESHNNLVRPCLRILRTNNFSVELRKRILQSPTANVVLSFHKIVHNGRQQGHSQKICVKSPPLRNCKLTKSKEN